jgi:urease accessory protein
MITGKAMTITTEQALYKLQTWFSPSYPVGAYTYSHGLENAFESGLVCTVEDACDWIGDIVSSGNGFADAVFLTRAHEAARASDFARLAEIAEYAAAFSGTAELRHESEAQGAAFIEVIGKVEPITALEKLTKIWPGPYAYSVAVGTATGGIGIDVLATCTAYCHGFVANLTSALVRIVPFGQTDGQRIIAQLGKTVERAVIKALETSLDELSTSTLMVDLTSMQHETQYTRLFRS